MQVYLALMSLLLMASCVKETTEPVTLSKKCTPTPLPSLIKSINLSDPNTAAGGQPVVAVFKFSQDLETYQDTNCKAMKPNCSVKLCIQNATAKKMFFDYTVTYVAGGNVWQFQNYSIIEPNKLEDLGVISKNCGWISGGNITITTSNIIYK
ncbi:MAG: hypothetical protein JHD28_08745 [Bacteroidia bacterium]|nr:hypothetical protein [Bacteroidia bacterium]